MNPKKMGLIINRAPGGQLNEGTREEIEKQGLNLLGVVPHNDLVYEYDCDGKPTVTLPADSPVRTALNEIIHNLGL
jgi:CO dehydrogenase maturation factor